ncbi:P-loop containing nucleoside triphosphate hydrolase protein [Terfezia boudieri ATCC MYA-4762]|uniref:Signal recognition particle receptor subunit alpha homolog n=1 Tax=Terfezia boudieri ATCC MYA-4762 TaxID=1051890 RepID=A0A3N4LXH3_9PEZI|nr:P-loop containing nucleoside triphosphate hydrolase protein [Terfezia boudieri ATCC MYA-4762]
MLDSFEVVSTSGVVLWSKKYAPVNPAVINALISDIFIEDRVQSGSDRKWYKKDSYTLKWRTANDFGLIFVAVYSSLLHLTWIDELLDTVKKLFIALYGDQLKKPHISTIECHFDEYFESRVRELEKKAGGPAKALVHNIAHGKDECWGEAPPIPGMMRHQSKPGTPALHKPGSPVPPFGLATPPAHSRPNTPGVLTAKGRPTPKGRRGGKGANGDEGAQTGKKKGGKKMRKWTADGLADEDDDDSVLDYSAAGRTSGSSDDESNGNAGKLEYIMQEEWGKKTSGGEFVLKDLDEEVNALLQEADADDKAKNSTDSGIGAGAFAYFRNIVGGKVLTKVDLEKPMAAMLDHLLRKNVAREAAIQVCETVEKSLVGQKTGNFQSIENTVKAAIEASLLKILTPTTSLDLLREIQNKKSQSRPYVISIVGVNGVGKSTNLSKICFFLLQNKFKVLIAACDTFRSGAVEQLRVHARNLKELSEREGGVVELYEKGYGKDAANIARDAVNHAEGEGFDVVLIDTAGRRHNDQRLMSSLEKFAKFAMPDKILMVGEALVGTDSVLQARNFNSAFGAGRSLDGFIISKCDTVGDMIGTLISMVFATGIPVLFLGTGQNYQDLRTLNTTWAVKLLMS